MPNEKNPAELSTGASEDIAGQSAATNGAGRDAATGVTGDDVDAGEAEGDAAMPLISPLPEQAPMDDDAGGPTVSSPEEDEATKLDDFA